MNDVNSSEFGNLPRSGFGRLVSELYVTNIDASRDFWCDILGFSVAYQRPEESFVYLENKDDAQVMLYQPNGFDGKQEVMSSCMLQLVVDELTPILSAIERAKWPMQRNPEEVWRRWGDRMGGRREIRLNDPDGHKILVAEYIGERPISVL